MSEKHRIAVVGGGLIGLHCAWILADLNHDVHVFDTPTSYRQSYDTTRAWMVEYSQNFFASQLMLDSLQRWERLEQLSGRQLIFRRGQCIVGPAEELESIADNAFLREHELACEVIDPWTARQRFSWLAAHTYVLHEPHAGWIRTDLAMNALWTLLKQRLPQSSLHRVHVDRVDATTVHARKGRPDGWTFDAVIIANGLGAGDLLPLPIYSLPQIVLELPYPAAMQLPFVTDSSRLPYLLPVDDRRVKVSWHTAQRHVEEYADWARWLLGWPFVLKDSSQLIRYYDMSPNSFPIIGTARGVHYAAGSSGQGAKFAPMIAKHVTDQVLRGVRPPAGLTWNDDQKALTLPSASDQPEPHSRTPRLSGPHG
jgi:glycine/D-amino acid oxidase-like deaminating enzyme